MVEGLTSYLTRLAEEHAVAVGDFVGRFLAEIPNPKGAIVSSAAKAFRSGSHGLHASSYAVNGTTEHTERWIYAFKATSGRRCCIDETATRHDLLLRTVLNIATELRMKGLYPSSSRNSGVYPRGTLLPMEQVQQVSTQSTEDPCCQSLGLYSSDLPIAK